MFRYDRLDDLVKETGKKKNYLCAKLGKCPTYLRDAKKQNTNIKGEDLRILAEELNTTEAYLLGETDDKKTAGETSGLSDEQARIIEKIKALNAEDFSKVSSAVEALLNIKL